MDTLRELLDAGASVTVVWEVSPAIGPGWIGGGRVMRVFVGEATLDPSCASHALLVRAVVETLQIPEQAERCVHGEAELVMDDGLMFAWEVHEAAPYADGVARSGRTRLVGDEAALAAVAQAAIERGAAPGLPGG